MKTYTYILSSPEGFKVSRTISANSFQEAFNEASGIAQQMNIGNFEVASVQLIG